MEKKIKGILLGVTIGDALGTPLDGLSRGHIHATFKTIDTYIDPLPALKGRINRWRKPGLYSSISQMMILIAMLRSIQSDRTESKFIEYIKISPEIGKSQYGIFRHPGALERHLIERIKYSTNDSESLTFSSPCARITPIIVPALLCHEESRIGLISRILSFTKLFNSNYFSIAGALSFGLLLRRLINEKSTQNIEPVSLAIEENEKLQMNIRENASTIFKLKINPDSLEEAMREFTRIYHVIKEIRDNAIAEERIYQHANRFLKNPITRATVNHTLSIIPYSIHLARMQMENPSEALFSSLSEGGASAVLCALTGSIMGALYGTDSFPDCLIREIVNKKKIINIINAISVKGCTESTINDFIESEMPLTVKEIEELQAKTRHWKPAEKQKKSKRAREIDLSTHVVESWTKIDKAKWKRERDKHDKHKH
jgi:ADP-ribosyl-[dinitrogen reductase] hydrolase